MKEITIPTKLMPLIKAFYSDEQSAKKLIIQATKSIYISEDSVRFCNDPISNEELEGVIALMNSINPKDTLEMIYGAQIITSQLLGLRLMSHSFSTDQALGLKLLKFNNEVMNQLQKKRSQGTTQNIRVNFNYNDQSSVIQTKELSCQ